MRGPLDGIRVVEVASAPAMVANGLATSLPGRLLADFGAEVARVEPSTRTTLDADLEHHRVWDRGKDIVRIDPGDGPGAVTAMVADADVVVLSGPEPEIEGNGLGSEELRRDHPALITVRIRPTVTCLGPLEDLELLVHARNGLQTQIRGNRPGPVFGDLNVASAGAGLAATVASLAMLFEREESGVGGWAETSLQDGLAAILPMIIGRVEHETTATELLWVRQGPGETLAYRCADGEYLQLWFGAKGAYESFLEHMDEPPSADGYNAEMISGAMAERSERWSARFATRDRDWWLDELSGRDFRCEPVWRPGQALHDAHVREVGLAVDHVDPERGPMTIVGPVARVEPAGGVSAASPSGGRLLDGIHVLDLSAYLAGPVATQVLAELGADVVKVEPPTGDAHRGMEPMFAAGQRGKRAMTLDLKSPDASGALQRLFRWSDVVHHNARVGLAERLGYDEGSVRAAGRDVVYSFASGFGTEGPRARLPANDHLMQALSGVEASQGGFGRPPTFLVWGAIDVASGWLSAAGIIAGLFARRRNGGGQSVRTSLLGAAMMLESGAFLAGDEVVSGPVLDAAQTGYGAAYRIYECADGRWLAIAVPDAEAWRRLRDATGLAALPEHPPPLRVRGGDPQVEETLLERAMRTRPAGVWWTELRGADVPSELVTDVDRRGFVATILDDPVGRQISRVSVTDWGERGRLEQPGFAVRFGPTPRRGSMPPIPGLGEHTDEVLAELDGLTSATA